MPERPSAERTLGTRCGGVGLRRSASMKASGRVLVMTGLLVGAADLTASAPLGIYGIVVDVINKEWADRAILFAQELPPAFRSAANLLILDVQVVAAQGK